MQKLRTLAFGVMFLFGFYAAALAQCNTATCTTPVPATNAQDACILPNPQALNCYYGGTTPNMPESFPPSWCSDINNNHWFAFTATSPLAFFTFTVYGCNPGIGIQVAVLSTNDCINFQTVSSCLPVLTVTSSTLVAPGLIPGQVYYLCIDGIDGALCGYSINGANPSINVAGSPTACIPDDPTVNYTTAGISSWSINPPGAGMIIGNPVGNFVTVEWLQPGPAEICAQNVACPGAPLECRDVLVGGGLTLENVNLCEGKTVSCGGQTFSTPGFHELHFSSSTGCDSTVLCFVNLILRDTSTESHTVCQGDSVRCGGKYFHDPGNFYVNITTPIGCDSTIKCQITVLPKDTTPLQKVNLCGPASFSICDTTVTSSGVYTRTCTNIHGCDSLVTVDLAIFQPNASINPPETLRCGNDTITLVLNDSLLNHVSGGITRFDWDGPGIIGPDTLQTVQVNLPGQYCLILTFGRDSVFCSDTTCVTVLSSGSIPQTPLITGNLHPCPNTSSIYTAIPVGLPIPASYSWSTPGNVPFTQIAPDSIVLFWPDTAVTGQICVTANDSCGSSLAACLTVESHAAQTSQTLQICHGETVLVGGMPQGVSGVYTDTLQTVVGCDSIVTTNLIVLPIDTVLYEQNTCIQSEAGTVIEVLTQSNGCDSLVITRVIYWPGDTLLLTQFTCHPADTGVFIQHLVNQHGCDSLVMTSVLYTPADSTFFQSTTCDLAGAGTFVQTLTDSQGCDSLLVTTVTFIAADTVQFSQFTCDPANAGIFVQSLQNQYGCDSVVVTTIELIAPDTTLLTGTTCDPFSAGTFIQTLVATTGCDSVVVQTISLLPPSHIDLFSTTCDPAAAGVFTDHFINQYGCDSTVTRTIVLKPGGNTLLEQTTCDPAQVGSVTQILSNQYGCDSTVTTVTTLLPPAACSVEVLISGSTIPCSQTTGTLAVAVTQGVAPFQYNILSGGVPVAGGSINATGEVKTIAGLSAGNYTVVVSSASGATTSATVAILVLTPPDASVSIVSDFNGYAVSCAGETDGSAQSVVVGGTAPFLYLWSNGQIGATLEETGAGTYTVTVTDANNCVATASATLQEPSALSFSLTVNNLSCFGSDNGAIRVDAQGGTAPYRYALGNGPFQVSNLFGGLTPGSYTITVLDANDCQRNEIILVNAAIPVNVDLGDDQTIQLGGITVLQAIVNIPIDSILSVAWTPPQDSAECQQCLEQVVAPFISTTYSVQVTALNGCSGTDNITVVVDRRKYLYIPNVFSPNGDLENDLFRIFAKPGTVSQIKSFQIFDRWGDMVYLDNDFDPNDGSGWDGRFSGKEVNPGVYVWYTEVVFRDGTTEKFKGDVTLIR